MTEQTQNTETLSNLLTEDRRFEPPAELAANANVTEEAYARADADREGFWAEAAERLDWGRRWDQVLDWSNPPFAKWFVGGTLNASVNCVDRHVAAGKGDAKSLVKAIYPELDKRLLLMATGQVLSHLHKLQSEGRVRLDGTGADTTVATT